MAKQKSDTSDRERKNETSAERGGVMAEDRSKAPEDGQYDRLLKKQKGGKAAAVKKR